MKKLLTLILAAAIALSAAGQGKTCKGITKAGIACKSTITDKAGYCRAHSAKSIRCAGENKAKKPCGTIVKKKGEYCRHHKS